MVSSLRPKLGSTNTDTTLFLVRFCFALFFIQAVTAGAAVKEVCEEGQVQSAGICVYKEICDDGRGSVRGRCVDMCWDGKVYDPAVGCNGIDGLNPNWSSKVKEQEEPVAPTEEEESMAPPRDCTLRTVFANKESSIGGRTLFLVNGPAPELVRRYFRDLAGKGVRLTEASLAIFFYLPNGDEFTLPAQTLTFGQQLAGVRLEDHYLRKLEGLAASDHPRPSKLAEALGADYICGV